MPINSTSEICTLLWPYLTEDDPTILLPRSSSDRSPQGGGGGGGVGPRLFSSPEEVIGGSRGYAWIVGWTLTGLNVVIATFLRDMTLVEAIQRVEELRQLGRFYAYGGSSTSPTMGPQLSPHNLQALRLSARDITATPGKANTSSTFGKAGGGLADSYNSAGGGGNGGNWAGMEAVYRYLNSPMLQSSGASGDGRHLHLHLLSSLQVLGVIYTPRYYDGATTTAMDGEEGVGDLAGGGGGGSPPDSTETFSNEYRIRTHQRDIWLELSYQPHASGFSSTSSSSTSLARSGPKVLEVLCSGYRLARCQLHVFRCDQRQFLSQKPVPETANALYGGVWGVQQLWKGERPIPIRGAESVMEGVLLPLHMKREAAPRGPLADIHASNGAALHRGDHGGSLAIGAVVSAGLGAGAPVGTTAANAEWEVAAAAAATATRRRLKRRARKQKTAARSLAVESRKLQNDLFNSTSTNHNPNTTTTTNSNNNNINNAVSSTNNSTAPGLQARSGTPGSAALQHTHRLLRLPSSTEREEADDDEEDIEEEEEEEDEEAFHSSDARLHHPSTTTTTTASSGNHDLRSTVPPPRSSHPTTAYRQMEGFTGAEDGEVVEERGEGAEGIECSRNPAGIPTRLYAVKEPFSDGQPQCSEGSFGLESPTPLIGHERARSNSTSHPRGIHSGSTATPIPGPGHTVGGGGGDTRRRSHTQRDARPFSHINLSETLSGHFFAPDASASHPSSRSSSFSSSTSQLSGSFDSLLDLEMGGENGGVGLSSGAATAGAASPSGLRLACDDASASPSPIPGPPPSPAATRQPHQPRQPHVLPPPLLHGAIASATGNTAAELVSSFAIQKDVLFGVQTIPTVTSHGFHEEYVIAPQPHPGASSHSVALSSSSSTGTGAGAGGSGSGSVGATLAVSSHSVVRHRLRQTTATGSRSGSSAAEQQRRPSHHQLTHLPSSPPSSSPIASGGAAADELLLMRGNLVTALPGSSLSSPRESTNASVIAAVAGGSVGVGVGAVSPRRASGIEVMDDSAFSAALPSGVSMGCLRPPRLSFPISVDASEFSAMLLLSHVGSTVAMLLHHVDREESTAGRSQHRSPFLPPRPAPVRSQSSSRERTPFDASNTTATTPAKISDTGATSGSCGRTGSPPASGAAAQTDPMGGELASSGRQRHTILTSFEVVQSSEGGEETSWTLLRVLKIAHVFLMYLMRFCHQLLRFYVMLRPFSYIAQILEIRTREFLHYLALTAADVEMAKCQQESLEQRLRHGHPHPGIATPLQSPLQPQQQHHPFSTPTVSAPPQGGDFDLREEERVFTRASPPVPSRPYPTRPYCGLHPVLPHQLPDQCPCRGSVNFSTPPTGFSCAVLRVVSLFIPWHDICRCNYIVRCWVDAFLGVVLYLWLVVGGPLLYARSLTVAQHFLVDSHLAYLKWFETWPAGLKLNEDVCLALGFLAQTVMELMDVLMRWSPTNKNQNNWAIHPSQLQGSSLGSMSSAACFGAPYSHGGNVTAAMADLPHDVLFVPSREDEPASSIFISYWFRGNRSSPTEPLPTTLSEYSWVVPGYYGLLIFSLLGASCGLAWIADITVYVSLHLRLLHHGTALLFYWTKLALKSLYAQFRGMRYNPLRQRADTYEFQADQLLVAVLLFAVVVFLAPTIGVYYFYFALIRISVWVVQEGLAALAHVILYLPVYPILHWCYRQCSRSAVASRCLQRLAFLFSSSSTTTSAPLCCYHQPSGGGIALRRPVITQRRTVEVEVHPAPLPLGGSLFVDFRVVTSILLSPFTTTHTVKRILNGEEDVSLDHLMALVPHLLRRPEDPECVLPQKGGKSATAQRA